MEIKAYVAVSKSNFIKEVEDLVYMALPNFEIKFSSLSLAATTTLGRILPDQDFILLIPQAQVTEFILVLDKNICANISVPFGKYSIGLKLAKLSEFSPEEAFSLLRLLHDKSLAKKKLEEIQDALLMAREEWHSLVKQALSSLGKSILLPNQIYLLGHNVGSAFLSKWIIDEEYSQQSFLVDKFRAAFFSSANISHLINYRKDVTAVPAIVGSVILHVQSL